MTGGDHDEELMAAAIDGSVEAFGALYDRYSDRAYRVALSICRDQGRAQDAVEEALIAVWKSPADYRRQRGSVAAWLLSSVRHRAIDLERGHARHANRRVNADQLESRPAPDDVCETVVQRDDADRLHATLARLPDAQAEAITLAFYGRLTHTEIATHLGLPPGTVKGRMRLGLQKLRAEIERDHAA